MRRTFEDLGSTGAYGAALLESFRGVDIVAWQGKIERQLSQYVNENAEARNFVYADKLREFLKVWRDHTLTGSINVETVDLLEAAAAQLAVDPWRYQNYFSNLRDQLRKLKASVEELPVDGIIPPNERRGGSAPPATSEVPQAEAPRGEAGEGASDLGAAAAAGELGGEAPSTPA